MILSLMSVHFNWLLKPGNSYRLLPRRLGLFATGLSQRSREALRNSIFVSSAEMIQLVVQLIQALPFPILGYFGFQRFL